MSDRIPSEHRSRSEAADRQFIAEDGLEPGLSKPQTGVHPTAIGIGLAAALWFIAVTWVSFARGAEVDWDLVVVTLFFVFFFALFLFTELWIEGPAGISATRASATTGPMSGREVLLEIAVMPVSLALAATVVGLIWIVLH